MKDEMENDLHLKISLHALAATGSWPLKFKTSRLLEILHIIYCKLITVYFALFVLTEQIDMFNMMDENLMDIVDNLSVTLLYTVTLSKRLNISGKPIGRIVAQIRTVEKSIIDGDDEEAKRIYLSHVRINSKLGIGFIITAAITLFPFLVDPLRASLTAAPGKDRPLPFHSWFPFNKDDHWNSAYTIQFIAGMIGGFTTAHTDIFYWSLMIFAIGQIKILQYKLRNLSRHAQQLVQQGRMTRNQAINHCMKDCIVLHQMIIDYVVEVDDKMKWLMLMDFAICSLLFSVIGFKIIVAGFGYAQIQTLEYLLVVMGQAFMFYWLANEITLESVNIAGAIWDGEIYEYPLEVQKSLQLVMLRAQKPLTLNVGLFYSMSTQTAISIVRAAFSYIALMRQIYGN